MLDLGCEVFLLPSFASCKWGFLFIGCLACIKNRLRYYKIRKLKKILSLYSCLLR